jgi:hypothetical protein
MIEVLFGVLLQGLKLANSKESTKYLDEVLKLQQDYLDEYNKPRALRSNANLDDIELRLQLISKLFISSFGKPNA